MTIHLGHIHQLVRYPVKSMAGVAAPSAILGWHGLKGDRHYAFHRLNDTSGFPWLSASKLPELVLYQPLGFDENAEGPMPIQVRAPGGMVFALPSPELQKNVAQKSGSPLELMNFRNGIFDEAEVSVITLATMSAISREAGLELDARRFRANIVIASDSAQPFTEDGWLGGRLVFGDGELAPMITVTMRDLRCMMLNINPTTGRQDPGVMKAAVSMNDNYAGVYATVARTGRISTGQSVSLLIER